MSTGYVGRGSKLKASLDNITYFTVAQLKKFAPMGSKQTMVDQTNLRSPGPFTQPFAAQVDSGDIEFEGVYSGDTTQMSLGFLHGQMQQAWFQVQLTDGTTWSFQGLVSEFVPWSVTYDKHIPFSGKLRIVGGLTPPSGPLI